MRIKALTVHCAIITILVYSFLIGYTSVAGLPSYADNSIEWENCTTAEEQAEAFKAYCKSRDLTIEGTFADGVTTFTTKTYQNLLNTLGLNVNAIQANIKKSTDSNGAVKFLFNASGINVMNRVFSQFLQDYDLEVGDAVGNSEADGQVIYNGEYINYLGYGCFSSYINDANQGYYTTDKIAFGTFYKYSTERLVSSMGTDNVAEQALTFRYYKNKNDYDNNVISEVTAFAYMQITSTDTTLRINLNSGNSSWKGNIYSINNNWNGIITINKYNNGTYWLGTSCNVIGNANWTQYSGRIQSIYIPTDDVRDCDIFIYSPTINNNNYTNNTYTTINNDGDVYNYDTDEEPDPDDNPSGGGGGGNDTTTPPTDTGGGDGEDDTTITFPDFDFNFPEINWSIGDLSNKFPFSIPFDLVAFFTVLNAEPQAPAIDAEIPLGNFYTWHFEADFSQFDNYAVIVRNVEFIAFVIGLIYLTIKLVRG